MHGLLLAGVTPDNTPHGYNLTFLVPEIGFIIVAAALFLRFRRRPPQVPGHAGPAIPLMTGISKVAVPGGGPAARPAPADGATAAGLSPTAPGDGATAPGDGATAPADSATAAPGAPGGGSGPGSPVAGGRPASDGPADYGRADAAGQPSERPPPDDTETGG